MLRMTGWNGGAEGNRTPDLVIANDALSQLSYGPVPFGSAGLRRCQGLVKAGRQARARACPLHKAGGHR